jgi:uncharacterized protein (TIRG00374 family)
MREMLLMRPNPDVAGPLPERWETLDGKKKGKSWGILLKTAITLFLFWFLFKKINIGEVMATLLGMDQPLLWTATAIAVGAVVLSAYKWQLLLTARGWHLSMGELTKIYFIGLFANNFLPSSIGGDMLRIYLVGKKINHNGEAAASVILERLLSTVGLAVPALLALIPNSRLLGDFWDHIVYFFICCFALTYLIMKPAILRPLKKLPWKQWQRLVGIFREIINIIQSFRHKRGTLVKVIFYSVMFQLAIILINFCLIRALGIHQMGLWHCFLLVPIISAVSMLPVSINGLGIREGAYVLLFGAMGVSASQAITVSLLFFVIVTFISLFGGILFVLEKERGAYQ